MHPRSVISKAESQLLDELKESELLDGLKESRALKSQFQEDGYPR